MKKTLLSMMACMSLFAASAATTTYVMTEVDPGDITGTYNETTYKADESVQEYANWKPLESLVLGNYTLTFEKGTNEQNAPAFYTAKEGQAYTVRVYKGNTFTVTSTSAAFNQITFGNYNNKGELSASAGAVTNEEKNIIWNGESTNTVTFTVAANCRFETISFSDEGSGEVVTPDDPVTPTVQMAEFAAATEFAAGQYVFVVGDKVANGYSGNDETAPYGYLKVGDATIEDGKIITEKNRAYTFEAVEGGYSLKNGYGKYVYMDETHNSVNLSDTMPEEAGVWTVAVEDGLFVLTNVAREKTMQYDSQYDSFGFYPDVRGEYPVFYKYVKDVEGGTTPDPVDPPVNPDPEPDNVIAKTLVTDAEGWEFETYWPEESEKSVWVYDTKYGAKASGFWDGAAQETEGCAYYWVDLTDYTDCVLTFEHALNYLDLSKYDREWFVEIYAYNENDDPEADMATIDVEWPTGTNWNFVNSGEISLAQFEGDRLCFVLYYYSGPTEEQIDLFEAGDITEEELVNVAGTWEVKNFVVTGTNKDNGVKEVINVTNAPAEYYNLNGVRVANPEKGLYIVRQGGKTSKVIIK